MKICRFLGVLPLQRLSYAQQFPAQVPDLLVKSCQRVPPVQKTVRKDNIWVSLFHTANKHFCVPDHGRWSISADTYVVLLLSHVSSLCSRYSDATRKYFLSYCFF